MKSVQCTIDNNILNKDTLKDMTDIGLSFFAATCGKNRGAFVLDPPDGKTYGWYDCSMFHYSSMNSNVVNLLTCQFVSFLVPGIG